MHGFRSDINVESSNISCRLLANIIYLVLPLFSLVGTQAILC